MASPATVLTAETSSELQGLQGSGEPLAHFGQGLLGMASLWDPAEVTPRAASGLGAHWYMLWQSLRLAPEVSRPCQRAPELAGCWRAEIFHCTN